MEGSALHLIWQPRSFHISCWRKTSSADPGDRRASWKRAITITGILGNLDTGRGGLPAEWEKQFVHQNLNGLTAELPGAESGTRLRLKPLEGQRRTRVQIPAAPPVPFSQVVCRGIKPNSLRTTQDRAREGDPTTLDSRGDTTEDEGLSPSQCPIMGIASMSCGAGMGDVEKLPTPCWQACQQKAPYSSTAVTHNRGASSCPNRGLNRCLGRGVWQVPPRNKNLPPHLKLF